MSSEKPSYSRAAYEDTETGIKDIVGAAHSGQSVEELKGALAAQEALVAQRTELHSEAWDQAIAENTERDAAKTHEAAQAEQAAADRAEAAALLERMKENAGMASTSVEATPAEQIVVPAQPAAEEGPVRVSGRLDELLADSSAFSSDFRSKALEEVSGGAFKAQESNLYNFDATLTPEQAEQAERAMEASEHKFGGAALNYVATPDLTRDRLQVGNDELFNRALSLKQSENERVRGNIRFGAAFASVMSLAGGAGAAAAGAAAFSGPLLLAMPVILTGGLAFAAGKRFLDKRREKKAVKDYAKASIAKKGRAVVSIYRQFGDFLGD